MKLINDYNANFIPGFESIDILLKILDLHSGCTFMVYRKNDRLINMDESWQKDQLTDNNNKLIDKNPGTDGAFGNNKWIHIYSLDRAMRLLKHYGSPYGSTCHCLMNYFMVL